MEPGFLKRLEREAGVGKLIDVLTERLSPTDLQSLLLEVYRRRAAAQTPAQLEGRYAASRFLRLAAADPARMRRFDELAFETAVGFEALELSPLAPLGVCSVLSALSQDLAIATSRNNEVASDPTNVLALECARRRRELFRTDARSNQRVKLCTSQRVVRPQYVEGPNLWAHFRLFALCTAGRGAPDLGFEREALIEQIGFHVELLARSRRAGFDVGEILVRLTSWSDGPVRDALTDVLAALQESFPEIDAGLDDDRTTGRGYYSPACFQVHVRDARGEVLFLADGGFTDWTQKLLGNRRERLLISGFGSERFCAQPAPG